MNTNCLNCSNPVSDKYCSRCGQKTDTHRITLKHFIFHDLVHGVWHLEKGILFTLKETFTRPGQAALDYISGKRIQYYNIFYLSLLAIGLNVLASHYFELLLPVKVVHQSDKFVEFLSSYLRIIIFACVPILAWTGKLIFLRLRLNFAEHFIISGISLLGVVLLNLLFLTINFINAFDVPAFFVILEIIIFCIMLLFPSLVYANASKKLYKTPGILWRCIFYNILIWFQILLVLILIVSVITGKSSLNFSL